VELLSVLAQEKSQSLILNVCAQGVIRADETLLRQAFINVIHNAIKFTPEGGRIEVEAQLLPSMAIEIHVDDRGPGIPEINQARVFERFSRLSSDQPGTGLGLAIVKCIIEGHHGEVSVSRSALGGARFTMHIPCHANESANDGAAFLSVAGTKV